MAEDRQFSTANGKISIESGKQPSRIDPKKLLAGVKNVKRNWIIVGAVVSAAVVGLSSYATSGPSGPAAPPPPAPTTPIDTTPQGMSTQKDWKTQAGADIAALKQTVIEQNAAQREMLARMEALRQELAQAKTAPAAAAAGPSKIEFSLPPPPEPPASLKNAPSAPQQPQSSSVLKMEINPDIAGAPPAAPRRSPSRAFVPTSSEETAGSAGGDGELQEMVTNDRIGFLPAASFADATLISGVEAFTGGTAQAQPQPIIIRLDANAVLPNASQYQIRGCHVLASVWGDMSSERVFGRLATLTCVDAQNKLVLSEEVEGTLVDSDGKNGIRGVLQDRQGAKLARSLLAGFAQGMANAFGMAQQTTTSGIGGIVSALSGSHAAAAAGYQGANQAASSLASFYMKQAEATMPVIAVDAGRKVSVLFTKSKALKFEQTGAYKNKLKPVIKVDQEAFSAAR